MAMSPRWRRNFSRILPFGVIWLVISWVFLLAETIATGNLNLNPETAVTLTLPVFIFASIAVTGVGLLVGVMELLTLEKRFRYHSLKEKVGYKVLIYMALMFLLMLVFFPVATMIELGAGPTDVRVWNKTGQFFQSVVFLNTAVQVTFHLLVSLAYAAISEHMGHNVLFHFLSGRYHEPKEEQRVFMFLDMKDSTPIAENLGHQAYFKLLQAYYDLMSDAIIDHYGEVYQYIGDEVVITWKQEVGLSSNNCVNCFFALKEAFRNERGRFEEVYGLVPDFKAGMHLGEVMAGEVGALKKEIVYTGDTLNTTARIQGLCTTYGADLIVSEALLKRLEMGAGRTVRYLGELELKGKSGKVKLNAVE